MNSFKVTAVIEQLTLSSNDTGKYEGFPTTYTIIINHQLERYATNTVFTKSVEEKRNFTQYLSTS